MGASTALNIIARVGRVCLYTLPSGLFVCLVSAPIYGLS